MFTWGKKQGSRKSEPVLKSSEPTYNGAAQATRPAQGQGLSENYNESFNERSVDEKNFEEGLPIGQVKRNVSISRSGRHKARRSRLSVMTSEIFIDDPPSPSPANDQSKSKKGHTGQEARSGKPKPSSLSKQSSKQLSKPSANKASSSGCRDKEAGFKESMANQPTATAL